MIDRRGLLTIFGKTMIAKWFSFDFARASFLGQLNNILQITLADASSTPEKQLETNILHLGSRAYSEEGIPMFLACENLKAVRPVAPYAKALNAEIAPAFHHYVKMWQDLHPDASAADVANLVELLAYKDFASKGNGTNL